jgi:anti-anti-sigma factor
MKKEAAMPVQQRAFEATVRSRADAAIIDLHGEINAFAEEAINLAYSKAQSQAPETILLNFGDVDYINSTGIALIVGLLARARKSHIRLVTYGLSDHYVEIFHITRLSDFMTIASDESSALTETE